MPLVPHMLVGTVVLAANESDSIQISVGGNDVMLFAVVATSTGNFKVNFTPTDTNKKYATRTVPHTLMTGTAQEPFFLDPLNRRGLKVLKANIITVDVEDTSAAGNTIDIALLGYRIER